MNKKTISIAIPVYNEEENIINVYNEVCKVMDETCSNYEYEFIFTDNRSEDQSLQILSDLSENDSRVRVLSFSKNFGYQKSILTGYSFASGDAVIQLDCDLQDPPSLIPVFLKKWEEGNDVVYGIRVNRDEGIFIRTLRKYFYRLITKVSYDDLPLDVGDFRLCSRRVLDNLEQFDDDNPYIRGMITKIGFPQTGVKYDRKKRESGKSKFGAIDLVSLGLDGIINHSFLPLRLAFFVGMILTMLTIISIIGYVIGWSLGTDWPPGFATIIILILFSLGVNALLLGIIGEYLGRIYSQIKKKPLVIIDKKINIK